MYLVHHIVLTLAIVWWQCWSKRVLSDNVTRRKSFSSVYKQCSPPLPKVVEDDFDDDDVKPVTDIPVPGLGLRTFSISSSAVVNAA